MPELPEVETVVRQIRKTLAGLKIVGVWTDYGSPFHKGKNNIKDRAFFTKFKKEVAGKKIMGASREGKHVLIHLSGGVTILVHMKMTGHFLYGEYVKTNRGWVPKAKNGPLLDPYNRFIHVVFSLSNGKHLAFCDLRKFAKITFFHDLEKDNVTDLSVIGPDPLHKSFGLAEFTNRLKTKPEGKIKSVLMDQSVIAGIGNIYSDEILFEAGLHPEERIKNIPIARFKKMHETTKKILRHSIQIGGDSASDFRDIHGKKGGFQNKHKVYRRAGEKCLKENCRGIIARKKIGGRSAHFCERHQRLLG